MSRLFDENAAEESVNLCINGDLLSQARKLQINLSATLEGALTQELQNVERANWLKNNKKAIDALNDLADKNGLFSGSYRDF